MSDLKLVVREKKINEEAVKYLEELLVDAKEGKLIEFIMAYKTSDNEYGQAWTSSTNLIESVGMCYRLTMLTNARIGSIIREG